MKRSVASSCYTTDTPLMRSNIVFYENGIAPAEIVKDIETRLQVVTKVVPPEEVTEAYNAFVQKLNGLCYEKLAEQLIRPIRSSSINGAPSAYEVSIQSSQMSNKLYSRNPSSTFNNVMKAAAEVKKQKLATINETANSDATVASQKRRVERLKQSKKSSSPKSCVQDSDETYQYFRPPRNVAKSSRNRATSAPKQKRKYAKEDSVMSADLTITKSSLRNRSMVVYNTTQRRNYKRVNAAKATASEKDISIFNNNNADDSVQTSHNSSRCTIYERPKKTALSPFFNRVHL